MFLEPIDGRTAEAISFSQEIDLPTDPQPGDVIRWDGGHVPSTMVLLRVVRREHLAPAKLVAGSLILMVRLEPRPAVDATG
jgi:hypothetical protein